MLDCTKCQNYEIKRNSANIKNVITSYTMEYCTICKGKLPLKLFPDSCEHYQEIQDFKED